MTLQRKSCTVLYSLGITALFVFGCAFPGFAQSKTYTNSIGMEFVLIPAGDFYMGNCIESADLKEKNKKRAFLGQSALSVPCPSGAGMDSDASDNETPQHKVRISKAFYMGKYEVTVEQFKKFIAGAGRDDLLTDNFIKNNSHGDSTAVSYVSWDDARAFIDWLNSKEGGNRYRLPTEAEWEYACRAGTTTRYSSGDSEYRLSDYAWYNKMGEQYAHAVGRKKPNAWGLYDMHGNVWEWVQDWYGVKYYANSSSADPKGPSSGSRRVIRGGGWCDSAGRCRSALRGSISPDYRGYDDGFRVVLSPGQQ